MQDKLSEHDEENRSTVNTYLTDFVAAASAAGDDDYVSSARAATASRETPSQQQQVDALSNILESLGMPQGGNGAASSRSASSADTPATAGGTLTLADLQGAMAGLATSSPPPPPLTEILSPDSVEESGVLDDEDTVHRLLRLLPEGQRSREALIQNLRSPQCIESIKALQTALAGPDGPHNLYSILINFELDTDVLNATGANTNPVELFLDAVVKSVQKEKENEHGSNPNQEKRNDHHKSHDNEDEMEE